MKRLLLLISLLLAIATAMRAGGIADRFRAMPDSIVPVLDSTNRLDLLDFYASRMTAVVQNGAGSVTHMDSLTGNYLRLLETTATRVEMMLLPSAEGDSVICFVRTYLLPEEESEVRFYTSDWRRLSTAKRVTVPMLKDFILPAEGDAAIDRRQALAKADLPMVSATLNGSDRTIRFHLSADGGFTDVREEMKPFLRHEIVCRWNGKAFIRP